MTRRRICFPPAGRHSTMSRISTGSPTAQALLDRLAPHVERAGAIFDSLSPDERGQLSNDPDILKRELGQMGFADPAAAARHVGDWRSGKARSLRSPPAQQAFEAMLPDLMQAIAAGTDPGHALNRLSDIVERLSSGVNFFRLLEARPELARPTRQGPGPCARACRPARAKAAIVRRPVRCVELRDAAGPGGLRGASRRGDAWPALRRRRSIGCGAWSTNAASRSAFSSSTAAATRSKSPRAMRGSPKARSSRSAGPPRRSSPRRTAHFPTAS